MRGLAREDRELFAEGVEGLTKAELAGICESRRDALRGAEEGGVCGGARRVVAIFGGVADPRGDDGGE